MLNTLIALGSEIIKQQSEWDNLVEIPKCEEKTQNGEPVTNYVLIVTFDIDNQVIVFDNGLKAFSPLSSPVNFRNINSELWGRRGDPWMVTCGYPKKLPILQKSIFGKPEKDVGRGLFQKSLLTLYPEANGTTFSKALEACYSLRDVNIDEGKKCIDVFEYDFISKKINLPRNHKIVLLSIAIKATSLGINNPTLLCELDGYEKFIKSRFLGELVSENGSEEKLCYLTNKMTSNVILPSFPDREDLNNIFVTTTINYANNLDKKSYSNNYQVGAKIQNALKAGSNYIRGKLNNQRCSVRIANTEHFIIPSFLHYDAVDIKFEMDNIQKMSEWIFTTKQMANMIEGFEDEANEDLFWINYIAYTSDGNSVKVINHIKDVSSIWFRTIVRKNIEQINLFSKLSNQQRLNLATIYYSIPIRKEHEQKNDALKLLSQVLEQRKVYKQTLFNHFTELILCHYYKRYRSYSNITFKPETFDYAIRDSVVKYLFLLNLLKSLNLTDMEKNEKQNPESNEQSGKLKQFFEEMGYTRQQQSLYWLGRMVSKVGTAQFKKGHIQKPILNKINYNGMDYTKIQRLFVDSIELATQYNIVNEINYASNLFSQSFPADEKLWHITTQEGVFYLLSGFSLYFDNNNK